MKTILKLAFFIIGIQTANAQKNSTILQIGQQVPDLPIHTVNKNGTITTIKLSEFKGKKVIFDYWDKSCSVCIGAFPKIEDYQNKYQDKIKIIAITDDSLDDFKKSKNKYRNISNSNLTFAVADTSLKRLLPPPQVPYYIWISETQLLDSAIPPALLTDSTISGYANGKFRSYNNSQDDLDLESPARFITGRSPDKKLKNLRYSSRLKKSDPSKVSKRNRSRIIENEKTIGFEMYNRQLTDYYITAYFEEGIDAPRKIVTNDPTLKYILSPCIVYQPGYDTWLIETAFDYNFFSDDLNGNERVANEALKKDLEEKLQINAEVRDTTLPIYELIKTENAKLKFKDTSSYYATIELTQDRLQMINASIEHLANNFEKILNENKNCECVQVLNRTGINSSLDIDLDLGDRSPEKINRELQKFGLLLRKTDIVAKVLVLSRKQL